MRNYVKFWLTRFDEDIPPSPKILNIMAWGRDENEMLASFKLYADNAISAGGSVSISFQGPAYVVLDKAQLFGSITSLGAHSIPPATYQEGGDTSPRSSWAGKDRGWQPSLDDSNNNPGTGTAKKNNHAPAASKSDFSGAQTIVDTVLALEAAYKQLKKSRSVHDQKLANVIRFELDQMYAGKESIVDVLNHIAPFV